MKIAYIAGPYRAPTVYETTQNIQQAREVAVEFWKMGYAVMCPHLNSALMDGVVPDARFLAGDREFIRRMRRGDVFVLLPGWSESKGTVGELGLASGLGLTVAEWSSVTRRAHLLEGGTGALEAAS